jgi:poly(3-hydroxybutyrate) depolymerase
VAVLENGNEVRGHVFRVGEETRVNVYGCSVPEMTLGIRVLRTRDVRRVDPVEDRDHVRARLDRLDPDDVPGRLALLALARRLGLKEEARRIAEEVLRADPANAEGLRAVGGPARWAERRRGDPALDDGLAADLRRLVRMESGLDRRREAERLAAEAGYPARAEVVERMARSAAEDRGHRKAVTLRMRGEDVPAGSYALYVPLDYDPLDARPLVVALHGGGILTSGEKPAFGGSAEEAVALFEDGAERLGWFLACPTAVEAPWATPANAAFVLAVIEEVAATWNVDLDRVHLVGQGEGGDGAWWLGTREADRFATVGAAAAGPPSAAASLASRGIGLWIYHGDADAVAPVDPVRKAAERLLKQGADFVYCELPREGHGLPASAERDYYRYVEPKRNPRAKGAWPASSFARPATKEEVAAFGDPSAGWGATLSTEAGADELLSVLARGRPDAEHAARRLAAERPEGIAARAAALVADRKAPARGRAWAAWLCGELQDVATLPALGDAVRGETDPLLRRHAARALRRLGSRDALEDLRFALLDVAERFRRLPGVGGRVPFVEYDRACRTAAEVVEALGATATADVGADVEEAAVIGILRDPRPVDARRESGEDRSLPRARLAEAVARAYAALEVERTLLDMLRAAVRKDAAAEAAVERGVREGLPR